jgi:hypothetical protein
MDQYRAMYERSINDSDAFWKEVSESSAAARPLAGRWEIC